MFNIASIGFDAILNALLGFLVAVNALLGQLFSASGGALKWVLSLEITTQLEVVGIAWTLIRDMCNLVFIVVFIGIAFGTIFNTLGFFKAWHYRTALMPLLIAAILINFSLAIGKTIALVSNEAVKKVLSVMGDPGAILIENLKPNSLVMGTELGNASAALKAPIIDTTKTRTAAEQTRFLACLNEEKTVIDTSTTFWKFVRNGLRLSSTKVRKSIGDCNLEINDARYNTTPGQVASFAGKNQKERAVAQIPSLPTNDKIAMIASSLFNSLMILLLVSCLLSAFVFLALRIIMVWLLLATSALAFASFGIPGGDGFWQTWKKHIVAWNVFGPLYLLSLIPGLVMLGGSAEMMAQLSKAGGTIGISGMLVQQFFFYAFAVMIFVGGLAISLKSSFAITISKESGLLGGLASRFGVFQTGEGKLGQIAKYSGATARYEGAAAGVSALYKEKVSAPLARREEELTARYQARFGDKKAMETLQRKRIEEQSKKNKELGLSSSDLLGILKNKKKGSAEYFAAARELLDRGDLPADQMREYVAAAKQVSGAYGSAAQEAVSRKLRESAKENKFKGPDAVKNATAALNAITDGTERKKFLGELKKSSPLVYAQLATGQLLAVEEPGLSAQQIIENNTSKLEAEDMSELMKLASANAWTLGENVKYRRDTLLNDKNNVGKMMDAADPNTRKDIKSRLDELKREAQVLEGQKATVQAEAGVLAQERLEGEREDRARNIAGRTP